MRYIGWFMLSLIASPALAEHGEHGGHTCECSMHHWMNPVYTSELRFQMAVIISFMAALGVWKICKGLRSTRRCG